MSVKIQFPSGAQGIVHDLIVNHTFSAYADESIATIYSQEKEIPKLKEYFKNLHVPVPFDVIYVPTGNENDCCIHECYRVNADHTAVERNAFYDAVVECSIQQMVEDYKKDSNDKNFDRSYLPDPVQNFLESIGSPNESFMGIEKASSEWNEKYMSQYMVPNDEHQELKIPEKDFKHFNRLLKLSPEELNNKYNVEPDNCLNWKTVYFSQNLSADIQVNTDNDRKLFVSGSLSFHGEEAGTITKKELKGPFEFNFKNKKYIVDVVPEKKQVKEISNCR